MKTFKKKLSSDLERYFPQLKRVVLALSGGPDSIFLGELLTATLAPEQIIVAHFDHCLRTDSGSDAEFCHEWAARKKIRFVCEKWEDPQDSEEKARSARIEFLTRARKTNDADAIFVATQRNDVAETILFRFLRGCGPAGIAGIRMFDETNKIYRPLLGLTKQEILSALKKQRIPYRIDPTNAESKYSRNFLRNEIFPLLEKRFPDFQERIYRQAEVFRRVNNFLQDQATDFLKLTPDRLSRSDFSSLHPAVQSEVVRTLFLPREISFEQTEHVRDFIKTGSSGKKMSLLGKEISVYSEFAFYSALGKKDTDR